VTAMNMAMNWSIYHRRETAAQLGTVATGILILVISQTLVMSQEVPVQEEPVSLTIMAPVVAPDQIAEQPVQTIQPPPEKVIEPPKEVVPVTDAPAPAIQETVQPPKVEPLVQQKSNPDTESLFAQDVRSRIERQKVYPDTARDLGMTGEVEVLYELDRSGNLLRAEIASSSGYKLLDQAAIRAVKSASYRSFPDDAWMGASSKVFRTKLVFSINS
jgi:periplasmic protein TonB